jgi:hypothetical protein
MLAHVAAPRLRTGKEHLERREKNSSNQFDVYEDRHAGAGELWHVTSLLPTSLHAS